MPSSYPVSSCAVPVSAGMMIAVPAVHWAWVRGCAPEVVSGVLSHLAAQVPVERMLRRRRGPKKARTKPKKSGAVDRHVATKKLLARPRGVGPPDSGEELLIPSRVMSE